jgi:tRNA-2-methylthio-N6-dimethylallyladenosine synthase
MRTTARTNSQAEDTRGLLFIQTFGCQMNEYDSLRVSRILGSHGYRLTSDMTSADVIFINTCSVREKAEQKVFSYLGRLRRLKARNPALKIVLAGCIAQQLGDDLLNRFEYLDLVLGTRAIGAVGRILERVRTTNRRLAFLPEQEEADSPGFSHGLTSPTASVTAPVTIMQGCNNFCTYCIVPYVRGPERSRPSRDIIREIRLLASEGAREILLLGQNVNSYGRGLEEKTSFVDLLTRIQDETDILRIRFTTSHPKDLTEDLIRCFSESKRLCKYLHLPVQSGSDRILKLMNRRYTAARYMEKINRLREVCPEIALSSDAIVGFPGETEDDFEQTMQLLEEIQFDNLFSFRYSDRPFAKSSDFSDKVEEGTKARRLTELQSLQAEISLRRNRAEIGSVREILVEGPSKAANGQITGRTSQNRIVNLDGGGELTGRILRARIIAAFSHSLRGEFLNAPEKDTY